jgi:hypothetical protein
LIGRDQPIPVEIENAKLGRALAVDKESFAAEREFLDWGGDFFKFACMQRNEAGGHS